MKQADLDRRCRRLRDLDDRRDVGHRRVRAAQFGGDASASASTISRASARDVAHRRAARRRAGRCRPCRCRAPSIRCRMLELLLDRRVERPTATAGRRAASRRRTRPAARAGRSAALAGAVPVVDQLVLHRRSLQEPWGGAARRSSDEGLLQFLVELLALGCLSERALNRAAARVPISRTAGWRPRAGTSAAGRSSRGTCAGRAARAGRGGSGPPSGAFAPPRSA